LSAGNAASRNDAPALAGDAARLSEATGGGLVLVFAVPEGGGETDLRLRAAAGFDTPEDARSASQALIEDARRALSLDGPTALPEAPDLGERAAGGVWVRRLGRKSGALVITSPQPLSSEEQESLDAQVAELVVRLEGDAPTPEPSPAPFTSGAPALETPIVGKDSEELLRMSEALFAQDIELLRSREKLGTIERLKDDFIEKMSRELRTPLNHIIEAIISVLTGEDEALSVAAKSALRTALDEGSAFQRTLQNILDLWRIKQGELPVEMQDVNFRELVDEAIFSVQDAIGDRPVRIETDLVEPLPRLRCDLTKLNQILFMLIDNAVKFTTEGAVRIVGEVKGDRLCVEICDEGIGICHDDLDYIFDEFYQVDESESQKYRGAGLGLTLVRDLVSLLEGDIAVESDIGRGTSVRFSIPVQTS